MEDEEKKDKPKDAESADREDTEQKKPRYCSLCRRAERITGPLISVPGGIAICRDCIEKGLDTMQSSGIDLSSVTPSNTKISFLDLGNIFGTQHRPSAAENAEPKKETPLLTMKSIPAPHRIKSQLDQYVIGQEDAKKTVSVAVYNHYKRLVSLDKKKKEDDGAGVEIEKSNILLLGPTGCGKTYLVQTLARILDIPLALTDATSLTEAGYIGDDIESVVSKLLAAADGDVEKAQRGIIFIDEIDKIAKKHNTNQRDVNGEAVQQGMLKLLEGSVVEVPVGASSKNAMVPMELVDTRNILFICGGAFPDLPEIVRERLNKTSGVGFAAQLRDRFDNDPALLHQVTTEDLRAFGMIPEFLGRLPIVTALDPLNEDMLVRILREPKNAILRQYEALLAMDEVKLTFEEGALHAIAKAAMEKETGARGLRAVLEGYMRDIMYEIPKDDNIGEVVITEAYIRKTGGPRIRLRGQDA
ncbi:MAG: ATP-dependent Clp protease ATP-binding subunit ClpX [Lachnospiraceae bacterium]|nr:ATP-dependent Clp protease ATP-binding subunit ClpX [Lachnospiraceae bacterium]